MAFKTDFVVIGLGRFGLSIVKTLLQEHKSVMVLDCDSNNICTKFFSKIGIHNRFMN